MSFKFLLSGDLLNARRARGWSQPVVANAVSITLREYQNIEGGRCVPTAETFLKLVYLFELDIQPYREAFEIHVPVSSI